MFDGGYLMFLGGLWILGTVWDGDLIWIGFRFYRIFRFFSKVQTWLTANGIKFILTWMTLPFWLSWGSGKVPWASRVLFLDHLWETWRSWFLIVVLSHKFAYCWGLPTLPMGWPLAQGCGGASWESFSRAPHVWLASQVLYDSGQLPCRVQQLSTVSWKRPSE